MNTCEIINKIKALISKASDSRGNEHECRLAFKMAQKLMLKHNISQATIDAECIKNGASFNACERDIEITKCAELNPIAEILEEYFTCKCVWNFFRFKIVSTESEIDLAVFAFHFLYREMKYYYLDFKHKTGCSAKISYYKGFAAGMTQAIKDAKKEAEAESTKDNLQNYQLVLTNQKSIVKQAFLKSVPDAKPARSRDFTNPLALLAGYNKGKQTKINKPLEAVEK